MHPSVVWGPTCDSIDQILTDVLLPKLEPGDGIYWRNMGAYTLCAASTFNGFPVPEVKMVASLEMW